MNIRSNVVVSVTVAALFLCAGLLAGCEKKEDSQRTLKRTSIKVVPGKTTTTSEEWILLFDSIDLASWCANTPGSWTTENGVMAGGGGGDIWTRETFGDFTFTCEFKVGPKGNSGVFFRTGDTDDPVQTGIEMQIIDSKGYFGDPVPEENMRQTCGAVYDLTAPAEFAEKPAGEWNRVIISCEGSMIDVTLNGVPVVVGMNLDDWKEPHLNPDGTPNKFDTALRDFPRSGHIGFQDHGDPVWFRDVRIQKR